jgi:hypothetical protein
MPRKSKEKMQIEASYNRMQEKRKARGGLTQEPAGGLTFGMIRLFLTEGWGEIGARTADRWLAFNNSYFAGALRPLPIFFTNTTPFGKRLAHCCGNERCRHIALNVPKSTGHGSYGLIADANTILHEMVHQCLNERGVSPKHAHQPWREEIARIHLQITGESLSLGAQKVIKVKQPDGSRKSVRVMAEEGSLSQAQIARWPHNLGIDLGAL